jgi:hypothetical protein
MSLPCNTANCWCTVGNDKAGSIRVSGNKSVNTQNYGKREGPFKSHCQLKVNIFLWLGLDRLVEPLRNTCTMKVKANSVKQEYEKQDELKRSAMRAVAALLTISDAGVSLSTLSISLNQPLMLMFSPV